MIRHLEKKDFEEVYKLGNQISPNFSKTNDLEEIEKDQYTKVLVYEKENKIKAFLMYVALAETVDIIDIIVAEDARHQKMASCLLDYMISELEDTVQLITLEVRKSNLPAIHLYEKFAFEIITTRKNYYGNEDAYLMGRKIEK